uniref:Uncharacterized protein n=1 Tax=Podarcis muralis TaxID=64176 RepID=A0A670JBV5_PODMU
MTSLRSRISQAASYKAGGSCKLGFPCASFPAFCLHPSSWGARMLEQCQSSGGNGHLASIMTAQEMSVVAAYVKSLYKAGKPVWIGLQSYDLQKVSRSNLGFSFYQFSECGNCSLSKVYIACFMLPWPLASVNKVYLI